MARKAKNECACLNPKAPRRQFGALRVLPSGRHQARYVHEGRTFTAETTFTTHADADAYLSATRTDIERGIWKDPTAPKPLPPQSFSEYADSWLETRNLKPRTKHGYRRMLDGKLIPVFGAAPVSSITVAAVRKWYSDWPGTPSMRTAAYSLLRAIMMTAVDDELITVNPVRVRGASANPRKSETKRPTDDEMKMIVDTMPDRLKLAVELSWWCGTRQGETLALTRDDIDVKGQTVRVNKTVSRIPGEVIVGTPKTRSGTRTIYYPPHLDKAIRAHLQEHTKWGPDALLFEAPSGGHLGASALMYYYRVARQAAGRPDLRWHDIRHESASRDAEEGATTAELREKHGWSDDRIPSRYTHGSEERAKALAGKLSARAAGTTS